MAGLTLDVPTFPTVFGRGLISELKDIVAERYVVVTMRDLWSMEAFRKHFPEDNDPSFTVYFVESLEASSLKEDLKKMQARCTCNCLTCVPLATWCLVRAFTDDCAAGTEVASGGCTGGKACRHPSQRSSRQGGQRGAKTGGSHARGYGES